MNNFLTIIVIISLFMLLNNILAIYIIRLYNSFSFTKRKQKKIKLKKVSIIIPAYNEENTIQKKLNNLLISLNIKNKKIEVLIGSDGSTDSTIQIVNSFIENNNLFNWKLFDFDHEGKCQTINKLVRKSQGDLIISTDADVHIEKNCIRNIIDAFEEDDKLGCLSCIPILNSDDITYQSHYWFHDIRIRKEESKLGKLIVVTGWLYAFRKDAFREIPQGVMADDLWIPLTVIMQGYKSAQKSNVLAISETTDDSTELVRRRRVVQGGMDVVRRLFFELLLNPFLMLLVFSHKINRWLSGFWILLILIGTVLINTNFLFFYSAVAVVLVIKFSFRGLWHLTTSVMTPLLCFRSIMTTRDFSKWKHIRKET